jgi:HK97 family phage major capsid protein
VSNFPDELGKLLETPEAASAAYKDGSLSKAVNGYVASHTANNADVVGQLKEVMAATMTELLASNKSEDVVSTAPKATQYSNLYNPSAPGGPLDKLGFKNVGEFAQTVWHNNLNPTSEQRDRMAKILNYQEKVPSEGGFLVPEEVRAGILSLALEDSVVRSRATVVPMSSATLRFPAVDSTTNSGSVYGGIVGSWTEEGAELVETQGAFQAIKLNANKLTALAVVTNELVRDAAGGFNIYLEQLFPKALRHFEDLAFIKGNGVGQPLGILNAGNSALVTVAKESSQAADTIVWRNILKMYARMLPTSLANAVWLVTPEAFPQLATMTVEVKNVAGSENVGGSTVWSGNAADSPFSTLLGRPVIVTEKANLLGDAGDIAFVDLSMYLVGDRQQLSMDSSAHAKFTSDKTVFRIIERVDGRPWVTSAITPTNGGPTLSPYVQLADRA